jgi:hypothetical protein
MGTNDALSQQAEIEFLDAELDLSSTFLKISETEDDPAAAGMARNRARRGYETAFSWIGRVRDVREQNRLIEKLAQLKDRLGEL